MSQSVSNLVSVITNLEKAPANVASVNKSLMLLIRMVYSKGSQLGLDKAEAAVEKAIKKGTFTLAEAYLATEKAVKVSNRTKMTFDTYKELETFENDNETGSSWEEAGKYCCYAY